MQIILDNELDKLRQRLKTQGYTLQVSDEVKAAMLDKSDIKQYGARPIKRAIQTYLEDKITESMLNQPKKKTIKIESI